jgi:hypothetical protein
MLSTARRRPWAPLAMGLATGLSLTCAAASPPARARAAHSAVRPPRPVEYLPACPPGMACGAIRTVNRLVGGDPTRYCNYDPARRPDDSFIRFIVLHDTETAYDRAVRLPGDPKYCASWHYLVRSADGHVDQALDPADIAWHAGNRWFNAHSIGIEQEGWASRGTRWFTDDMYRSTARLVRYLARKYDIPLDRGHILGHDNVPGDTGKAVKAMHTDPGPYWDWAYFMRLVGAPLPGDHAENTAEDVGDGISGPTGGDADEDEVAGVPRWDTFGDDLDRLEGPERPDGLRGLDEPTASRMPRRRRTAALKPRPGTAADRPGNGVPADRRPTGSGPGRDGDPAGERQHPRSRPEPQDGRRGSADRRAARIVVIRPDFTANRLVFSGCVPKSEPVDGGHCGDSAARPSSAVKLHTEPRDDAPLLTDPYLHPHGGEGTDRYGDLSAVAATGEKFVVAGREGDWVAVWFGGRKAWLKSPPGATVVAPAPGRYVTPRGGHDTVPVYGRPYPERAELPEPVGRWASRRGRLPVPYDKYAIGRGQKYVLIDTFTSGIYYSATRDGSARGDHTTYTGARKYHLIYFDHRYAFVRADQVRVVEAGDGRPARAAG